MNCLLVFPEEMTAAAEAVLIGARARHAIEAHALQKGLKLRAGVRGGRLGQCEVLSLEADRVQLSMLLTEDPPARIDIELAVAVPRPQTVKKLLQLAASAGVSSLSFVHSENSVKSYWQSKTLRPERIEEEILKGLEQACDTVAPQISVCRRLGEYFDCLDKSEAPSARILLDTRDAQPLGSIHTPRPLAAKYVIAIGPEAGWKPSERERFERGGFSPISLGPRMLRVDLAAAFILGQIALLHQMRSC